MSNRILDRNIPVFPKDYRKEDIVCQSYSNRQRYNSADISGKLLRASQGDMEIIQPGKNEFSTIVPESASFYGMQCHLENMKGDFIYKLRIPLIRSNSQRYGIAIAKTKIIGIGFETGKIKHQAATKGSGGKGRRGGGRGRGGTEKSPEEGTGSSSDNREMMKPISTWLKVNLAAKP